MAMTNLLVTAPTWVAVKSVLICDERHSARQSLTRVVTAMRPRAEISSVADGLELMAAYAHLPADLVLIGIRRGRPAGAEAARRLLDLYPSAVVIVFGSAGDVQSMTGAIARGAQGLMLWDPEQRDHAPARPPSSAARLTVARYNGNGNGHGHGRGTGRPTVRELQILRGMSEGHSNGEIGRELFVSEDTVKTHARRLFQKLGARDRAHAVALGLRCGLVG
jgi:DNA-binding NarL/FixJ family response regulator